MMDMYQRPDKLREAMDRIADLTINSAITSANKSLAPIVSLPLHKGADGFMSVKQYETFYWPTLKRVLLAMVDEGILPLLFAEGSYNERLDIIKELPKGSVIWWFDQTDIFRAKKVLGGVSCLLGNVPASLLITGTPEDVKQYCRKLIEVCGESGGYVLTGGAYVDRCDPENLRVYK
jgi:uroporphyrinogen-III decarboxylase